jgi:AhpD family alkylhydroperoxidase
MQARIDSPALTVPGALRALQGIGNALEQSDIPETTPCLVELRASQINGCGVCVDIHTRELAHAGQSAERINTVAVWRRRTRRRSAAPISSIRIPRTTAPLRPSSRNSNRIAER